MRISDLLRLSTDNLRRRKGRTALTVIGVVVGTFSIIVMISLGIASNAANEEMLQSWGDLTQIQINNYAWGATNGEIPTLDDKMLDTLRQIKHVKAVTPMYQPQDLNATVYAGKKDRYEAYAWNVFGVDMDALQAMEYELIDGDFISDEMSAGKKKIPVLVGQYMGYEFEDTRKKHNSNKRRRYWGQTDAMGNEIPPFVDPTKEKLTLRLNSYESNGNMKSQDFELVVVGTFKQDDSKERFTNSGVVMRLSDVQMLEKAYKKLSGNKGGGSRAVMINENGQQIPQKQNGYENVIVKVDSVDHVEEVDEKINEIGYTTYSMSQIREEMQAQVANSQMILGGTAAVALLVAALNIANTMMMSIYERTKEIGVMKVLGCEVSKIRNMFLMEAGAIGLIGGIIGVALSFAASAVLNNLNVIMAFFGSEGVDMSGIMGMMGGGMGMGVEAKISIIPPWLILLGLGFSTLVGILSGLWPAVRATKISALEAIRHD